MLKEKSDLELIETVQSGVNHEEAMRELVDRHSGAFYSIMSRYLTNGKRGYNTSVDRELLAGSKNYIIFKSAMTFDKSRGTKFVTHLCNSTRFFALHQLNKEKETVDFEDVADGLACEEPNISNKIDSAILNRVMGIIENECPPRIKKLFHLRYFSDKKVVPWIKIHKQIPRQNNPSKHMTIQGCINLHDKTIEKIKKKAEQILEHAE